MQAFMEDRWNPAPLKPCKPWKDALNWAIKSRNPNLYYENLYMEYYHFCQQRKDYFEITSAKGHKRTALAVSVIKDRIFFHRQ